MAVGTGSRLPVRLRRDWRDLPLSTTSGNWCDKLPERGYEMNNITDFMRVVTVGFFLLDVLVSVVKLVLWSEL